MLLLADSTVKKKLRLREADDYIHGMPGLARPAAAMRLANPTEWSAVVYLMLGADSQPIVLRITQMRSVQSVTALCGPVQSKDAAPLSTDQLIVSCALA